MSPAGCLSPGLAGLVLALIAQLTPWPAGFAERTSAAHAHEHVRADGRKAGEQDPAQAIRSKVADLVAQEIESLDRVLARAAKMLDRGDAAGAREAIESVRGRPAELLQRLRWCSRLAPKAAGSLSMIKVRIGRVRSNPERLAEDGSPEWKAWAHVMGRFSSVTSVTSVDAEILEIAVVGKAFQPYTIKGRRHSSRLRRDLEVGRAIQLRANRSTGVSIGRDSVDCDYWVVIEPPFVGYSLVPSLIGSDKGPSSIVLAMPVR